ncbi:MAG: hypothetical protein ISR60_04970 [Anaerolineales bacterium]|nr:hypothetical protein [Anaerolineales bacterium]
MKNIARLLQPKTLTIFLLLAITAVVIYGFAAANVVPESGAGDGTGTVSGYTISNIEYTLLSADPTKVDTVEFDVAATAGADPAADVRITVDSGTTWITCSNVTTHWTCDFGAGSEPSVTAISDMQVVATQ